MVRVMFYFELTEKIQVVGIFSFLELNFYHQPSPLRPRNGLMQETASVSSFPDRLRGRRLEGCKNISKTSI